MEKHYGSQICQFLSFMTGMSFLDSFPHPKIIKQNSLHFFFYYCSGLDPSENFFCYNKVRYGSNLSFSQNN